MNLQADKTPARLLERVRERPSTFAELAAHFGVRTTRQRRDLFDALSTLLSRGLVLRMGDRGHYLYATERPALPAIDLQPVSLLTLSLGVVCERRDLAA